MWTRDLDIAFSESNIPLHERLGHGQDQKLQVEACAVLRKMRRVVLQFLGASTGTYGEFLAQCCRMLGGRLRGKVVSVATPRAAFASMQIAGTNASLYGVYLQQPAKLMTYEELKATLILRCASIDFVSTSAHNTRRLASTIVSNEPVFDTYRNAHVLFSALHEYSCGHPSAWYLKMPNIMALQDNLVSISTSFDLGLYTRARAEFFAQLETRIMQLRETNSERRRAHIARLQEELGQHEAEMTRLAQNRRTGNAPDEGQSPTQAQSVSTAARQLEQLEQQIKLLKQKLKAIRRKEKSFQRSITNMIEECARSTRVLRSGWFGLGHNDDSGVQTVQTVVFDR